MVRVRSSWDEGGRGEGGKRGRGEEGEEEREAGRWVEESKVYISMEMEATGGTRTIGGWYVWKDNGDKIRSGK